jgi:hypothetical protein
MSILSQKDLNKNYLLKSEHYYCMLLCKGSEPSMSALVNRGCKLKQRHSLFEKKVQSVKRYENMIHELVKVVFNSFYSRVTER